MPKAKGPLRFTSDRAFCVSNLSGESYGCISFLSIAFFAFLEHLLTMPLMLQILIFIIGLLGYGVSSYGLWLIHPPVAYLFSGAFAAWWSWYVTIGVHLHKSEGKDN